MSLLDIHVAEARRLMVSRMHSPARATHTSGRTAELLCERCKRGAIVDISRPKEDREYGPAIDQACTLEAVPEAPIPKKPVVSEVLALPGGRRFYFVLTGDGIEKPYTIWHSAYTDWKMQRRVLVSDLIIKLQQRYTRAQNAGHADIPLDAAVLRLAVEIGLI